MNSRSNLRNQSTQACTKRSDTEPEPSLQPDPKKSATPRSLSRKINHGALRPLQLAQAMCLQAGLVLSQLLEPGGKWPTWKIVCGRWGILLIAMIG